MPDDSTAGQGTGTGPDAAAQAQGQDAAPGVKFQPPADGTGAHSATEDRSAEAMLADAAADGDGKEDPLKTAQAEIARWKKQARENETRAKANADKAKNFDAYEESQKTEQQKLADRASAAEQRAAEAEGRYMRTLAAATYDLPPALIDQLGSGTEDEINARAETLSAAINERAAILAAAQAQANGQQRGNGGGLRPVESLRPGGLPAGDSKPKDANAWMRAAIANKR